MTGLRLDNVTLGYDRHPAVHHVSGVFAEGSLTAVVGPNGAGKTTLMRALVGLMKPLEGRIDRGGLPPSAIAYLPQQAEIDRGFPFSVLDTVLIGHWARVGAFRPMDAVRRRAALAALDAVGLSGFTRRQIGSVSVGQFRRVLFARLLVQDCRLILLDEPFAGIDSRTTRDLVAIVRHWHAEGRTVVAVLHDLDMVREHFPQALLIAREPVAWGEAAQVLTPANLRRARAMLEAFDDQAAVCRRAA
ncbi:MAG: ABC transporter ATP-binding protein [Rhodospirillaceae bacterium]|nr:ABC transporter ATP-binding protein [Rhodospirillaceae bacterium]